MKSLKRWAAELFAAYRTKQIRNIVSQPEKRQRALLANLLNKAQATAFGAEHYFAKIKNYDDFRAAVPVRDYEAFRTHIERITKGEKNVLWPGAPLYLAKTSGTTSGTKYIPLTADSMPCQVRGARDALLMYIHETKRSEFVDGRMIFLSGSPALETNSAGLKVGRLSGVAQHYVPSYLQKNRAPTYQTNCIEDWEQKISEIVEETRNMDMRLISGIPPWVQMYFEKLKEVTGKKPRDLWPNLQLFVQGGVDFAPYRPIFEDTLGKAVDIVEVYPASEGFIAVQNSQTEEGLLLMLDYGIFYEFIPLERYGEADAPRIPLWETEIGRPYALLLTTNAGLWAYDIGDVVKFTQQNPYKLKVVGRVKHFISAFGEHVIEEEVNAALEVAVRASGCEVVEFTVAPFVGDKESYHEWWIEFRRAPNDILFFRNTLDETLRKKNAYYNDLRKGGLLGLAEVRPLQPDATRAYMKSIGKLGGQNKFPRLTNGRTVAEGLARYWLID